jgi:hypothetical protein
MKDKIIALAEALRMLIRIRDLALADNVRSINDISRLRDKTLPSYREADRVILDESLEALWAAAREGRIRLRGTLKKSEPPIDIDKWEQQIGRLYIWQEVLQCGGRIYRDVHCYKSDVIKESHAIKGVSPSQKRRGAQPKPFWAEARDHVFDRLDHHGLPTPEDPDWSNQAAVEKDLDTFLSNKGQSVAESTIRKYVVEFIAEWKHSGPVLPRAVARPRPSARGRTAPFCRGGNCREARGVATDDADRIEERKFVGVLVGLEGGFVHQSANGKVRHYEAVEFLANQVGGLAAQDDFGTAQMSFEFGERSFDFPPPGHGWIFTIAK